MENSSKKKLRFLRENQRKNLFLKNYFKKDYSTFQNEKIIDESGWFISIIGYSINRDLGIYDSLGHINRRQKRLKFKRSKKNSRKLNKNRRKLWIIGVIISILNAIFIIMTRLFRHFEKENTFQDSKEDVNNSTNDIYLQIFVKLPEGKTIIIPFTQELFNELNIENIKIYLQNKTNIPCEMQRLIYLGRQLEDDKTRG